MDKEYDFEIRHKEHFYTVRREVYGKYPRKSGETKKQFNKRLDNITEYYLANGTTHLDEIKKEGKK